MATVLAYVQYLDEDGNSQSTSFISTTAELGFDSANSYYRYAVDLDSTQAYMLGIDQSLKSTGISLVSKDFSFQLVLTVMKSSIEDDTDYVNTLLDFIGLMLVDVDLLFVSIEQLPPSKYNRVSLKLGPLLGAITSGLSRLPSVRALSKELIFKVYPQTWKSAVYIKEAGNPKKYTNKYEIAKDIVVKFPAMQCYLDQLVRYQGHDFDGFDSFGLLFYTRVKCFNENWDMQNVGVRAQLGTVVALIKYVCEASVEQDLIRYFVEDIQKEIMVSREWNNDVSITENLIIAANMNKRICMEVTSNKFLAAHLIETGEIYDKDKRLFVIVAKEAKFKLSAPQEGVLRGLGFNIKRYYKE